MSEAPYYDDDDGALDERALRNGLRVAREKLDALVIDLHAVDSELEELAVERETFALLDQACDALEQLDARGAGELFWGDGAAENGLHHIRVARGRGTGFDKRIEAVESRRLAILEQIHRQEDAADLIAADVLEVERLEEQRKNEWAIERELETLPCRPSVMPWVRGGEDDQRFRKTLGASLLLCILLGLLLPLIDLPVPEPWEASEIPDRLTQLIREARPVTPIEPRPQTEPVPTSDEPEDKEPEALAKNEDAPSPAPEAPKKSASSKGILAFREKFSSLAKADALQGLGAKAHIAESGEPASGPSPRSLVATRAANSSGGIDVGSLNRSAGGGGGRQLQGVQIARATSSIGGTGTGSDRPLSDGPGPSRTDEEIQIVFDRHKAALYRLYNRELRRNPTLKGQIVLRMTIEPDGSVSLCELKSTDMDSPKLAQQVIGRVQKFDFGAKEGIPPVTILYPIDFLPAA